MNSLDVVKIREKLGFTQEQFANLLNVSLRTVQNYESGGTIPKSKHAILRKLKSEDNNVLKAEEERPIYGSQLSQLEDKERIIHCLEMNLKDKEKLIDRSDQLLELQSEKIKDLENRLKNMKSSEHLTETDN